MQTINDRILILRKELKLSQESFGEKIGIKKAAISLIEKSKSNPSAQTIKSICREFNVNYAWLKDGIGDIFSETNKSLIDLLCEENELNDIQRRIIETVIELDDDEINAFTMRFFGFKAIEKDDQ